MKKPQTTHFRLMNRPNIQTTWTKTELANERRFDGRQNEASSISADSHRDPHKHTNSIGFACVCVLVCMCVRVHSSSLDNKHLHWAYHQLTRLLWMHRKKAEKEQLELILNHNAQAACIRQHNRTRNNVACWSNYYSQSTQMSKTKTQIPSKSLLPLRLSVSRARDQP